MSDKTICTTCLRLKQGLCDGEKKLTACLSYERMTNADKIRSMTDEELADWVLAHDCKTNLYGYLSREETIDWLKQEVSDNG